jgi:RNA polymerase sigma-70 factor, ECF subfamily
MTTPADGTAALLDLVARGDETALGTLFDTYREPLRQEIARALGGDPRLATRFDASDVVQEVFLDARKQILAFLADGRVDVRTWLRGLARERRLKFLRDHLDAQCRSVKRQRALPDESWQHPPQPAAGPGEAAAAGEATEHLRRALDRLPPDDREVIRLRVLEGRKTSEAAALLGTTPAAVAKRLERALRRLREAGGAGS